MWNNLSTFFGEDQKLLDEVKAASVIVPYRSGARIFGEQDTDDAVYCILEGEVRAVRYSEGGTEVWLDSFSTGSIFGEMAALVDHVRTADTYALTDIAVATMSGSAFITLIKTNGDLGHKVCRLLAARIHNTTRRVFEHATLTATARIYAELLRMANAGEETSVVVIANMVPINDLATKLNIARETVSRTISKLKDENILEANGRDLAIIRPYDLVNRLHR